MGGRRIKPRVLGDIVIVEDIAARDALLLSKPTLVHVEDASSDPLVTSGWAEYLWVDPDWIFVTSGESAGFFSHNLLSNIQGGTPGEYYHMTQAEYATAKMQMLIPQDMKDPTGFVDPETTIQISFDETTRTFTIEPQGESFAFWHSGVRFTKTETESIQITDVDGIHVIYYDETGSLVTSTDFTTDEIVSDNAFAAFVLWNTTLQDGLLGNELHKLMDNEVHKLIHTRFRSFLYSGGTLSGFSVDESGDQDIHAQFTVDSGILVDEDIRNIVPQLTPAGEWITLYLTGTNTWTWQKKVGSPWVLGTTLAAYNEWTGTEFVLTDMDNNDCVLIHVLYSNIDGGRTLCILGQHNYKSVADARDNAPSEILELFTEGLPIPEFVFLGSIIGKTATSMSNSDKIAIQSTGDGGEYIPYQDAEISQGYSPTDHRYLSGRDAENQHPASSIYTSVTSFGGVLSSADDTVQKALDTLDDHNHDAAYEPIGAVAEHESTYDHTAFLTAVNWGDIVGTLSNQLDLQSELDGKEDTLGYTPENIANKGVADGYCDLDSSGLVPISRIPASYKEITVVNNITERDALTTFEGLRSHVIDATDDPEVDAGWAEYLWTGTEWTKTAENESIDIVLSWSNITGKPTTFAYTDQVNNFVTGQTINSNIIYHAGNISSISHNSIGGLQGGTTDEYYHLTSAQHTALSTYVVGPALVVDNRIVLFDGTTGKLIKDSGKLLSEYAELTSPAFTGTPTAPTAAGGTNTAQISTTAFVIGEISDHETTYNHSSYLTAVNWGDISGTLANQTDLQSALNGKEDSLGFTPENIANKGVASGYCDLDSSGLVPVSRIPSSYREIKVVADITARDALTTFEGLRAHVIDATDDSTVDAGWAEYLWTGSAWSKTAENESIDVVVDWSNITGKPTTFAYTDQVNNFALGQQIDGNNIWHEGNLNPSNYAAVGHDHDGDYEPYVKNNFSATTDPGATNDSSEGYSIGSKWVNTSADTVFVCVDATATSAIWRDVTNSGGDVSGPASAVDERIAVFDGTTGKLIKDGGTLISDLPKLASVNTFQEPQIINKTGAASYLLVAGDAGQFRGYRIGNGDTGADLRWWLTATNAAESGSNAGSDFALYAYSDTGISLGTALEIERATRVVNFPAGVQEGGTALSSKYLGATAKAADSSKLNDATDSTSATGDTIVKRTSGGYIYGTYFNMVAAADTNTAIGYMFYTADGFLRKKTLANTKTEIVTPAAVQDALTETNTAGEALSTGDICYQSTTDGKFYKADADAESTTKGLMRIALSNISADASGSFGKPGYKFTTTGLTVGIYYLSTTAGGMTTSAPGSGKQVRIVGYARSSTVFEFRPSETWLEISAT
ncbi:MAG: hypothetical protein SVK08_00445 [Halobacteriota archaeon]|nr:hypothetical protein [Halobacteriota archaeon]